MSAETVGEAATPHLVVPYSLCTNDSKYGPGRAFSTSDDYFTFLRDAFDVLYAEGGKMMSCGLHMRLIGHPARIKGLRQFMDYVQSHGSGVWLCKRSDVAKHWMEHFPYEPGGGGSVVGGRHDLHPRHFYGGLIARLRITHGSRPRAA